MKFVEWPSAAGESEPLVMCVTGDNAVAAALDDMVRGRTVDGRRVVVRRIRIDVSARACVHIALATRAERMLAKPGMGVDEGVMIVGNEMARTAALAAARGGARA